MDIGARAVAADVLVRVWKDAAFTAAALDARLRTAPDLDPRDAGLATELCYGVLRTENYLEKRLLALTKKGRWALDEASRAHVLIAAYSICFLDRVPPFAAVSEAVSAITAIRDAHVAGFANAVLRRLADDIARAPGSKRPSLAEAAAESTPGWLRGSLRRSLGRADATRYLGSGPVPPPTGVCLAKDRDRDDWIRRFAEHAPHAEIEPGRISPQAILLRGAGDVRRLPGFERDWIVQEEGAQVVAMALGAREGERVLDACAGRGNKAWLLRQQVTGKGVVHAADLYAAKLSQLMQGARKAWVDEAFSVDWSIGTGDVPKGYDRVLVDAPCSGIGTLRRRPEIAIHRTAEDVARLGALQVAIVRNAATRVRDGGTLVFGVCSVLDEEGPAVVERLQSPAGESAEPMLELIPFESEEVRALSGAAPTLRLLPHVHGTDGYFLASFRVRWMPAMRRQEQRA